VPSQAEIEALSDVTLQYLDRFEAELDDLVTVRAHQVIVVLALECALIASAFSLCSRSDLEQTGIHQQRHRAVDGRGVCVWQARGEFIDCPVTRVGKGSPRDRLAHAGRFQATMPNQCVQLFERARQRCIIQFRRISDGSHPGSMGKLVALFKAGGTLARGHRFFPFEIGNL